MKNMSVLRKYERTHMRFWSRTCHLQELAYQGSDKPVLQCSLIQAFIVWTYKVWKIKIHSKL